MNIEKRMPPLILMCVEKHGFGFGLGEAPGRTSVVEC